MLRTLYFFINFWAHQLLIYPKQRWLRRRWEEGSGGKDLRLPAWRVAHKWGKHLLRWASVKVEIAGNKDVVKSAPLLVVSNHQGAFDIPILLATLETPLGFVAKKELGRIPMISWWMRLIGCIFLDRENRRVQIRQIKETVETLRQGHTMVIFPEGTRSGDARMGEFAKGSLNIALKAGVPILPVSLKDSYQLIPAGTKRIKGGRVRLTLHDLIDPSSLSKEELETLHVRVRDLIASAV